jgi:hypothetical protein
MKKKVSNFAFQMQLAALHRGQGHQGGAVQVVINPVDMTHSA